jgi:hypothetical protein
MQVARILLLVVIAIILSTVSPRFHVYSQAKSCTEQLSPRLEIGGYANVQTPSLDLYDEPNGIKVGELAQYENSLVIAGPECNDGNWWYVKSDTGYTGWILESDLENGYFVYLSSSSKDNPPFLERNLYLTNSRLNGTDVMLVQSKLKFLGYDPGTIDGWFGPLTEEAVKAFQRDNNLIADGIVGSDTWSLLWIPGEDHPLRDCVQTIPSKLKVGDYVRIIANTQVPALFEGSIGYGFNGSKHPMIDQGKSLHNIAISLSSPEDIFLSEGPICYDGDYIWKIRMPENLKTLDILGQGYIWLYETFDDNRLLQIQAVDHEFFQTNKEIVSLAKTEPISIVSPEVQLGFNPGGGEFFIPSDTLYFGDVLGSGITIPFPEEILGKSIEVSIIQPDGEFYSAYTDTISREYEYEDPYVVISRPYLPGLQAGIWKIELNLEGRLWYMAYELRYYPNRQIWPNKVAGAWVDLCIDFQPTFVLTGFDPNETIELVEVSYVDSAQAYKEVYRWTITLSETGDAILFQDFEDDDYYLIVADENGNWEDIWWETDIKGYSGFDGDSNLLSPQSVCR